MTNSDLVSSVELVYQRTRRGIITGDYGPGTPLRLNELAERNRVSMIPVREALRMLEAEGFVESIPNRGARVAALSMDDMLDVYRTRLVLEVEALRQAMPFITPTVIEKAHTLNERLLRRFEEEGHAGYDDHRAFHFAFYEPSGSKWLIRLIGVVWDHSERYRRIGAPFVEPKSAREEHEQILHRVASGDVNGAVAALTYHLQHSTDRFRQLFLEAPELFDGQAPAIENRPPERDGANPAMTTS